MDFQQLTPHQNVEIDLSGLEADGVTLGPGLYGTGLVTEIRDDEQAVVRLTMPIAGKSEIVVTADRLTASN